MFEGILIGGIIASFILAVAAQLIMTAFNNPGRGIRYFEPFYFTFFWPITLFIIFYKVYIRSRK